MQVVFKSLTKLFVLSIALFSLSSSCSPAGGVKKTTGANPATGAPDTSQTPPDTSGPTCDLNNVTDECYDRLAGWYETGGEFIHFSGKDTKTVATAPSCDEKVSDYTDIYTIGPKGEITWQFQGSGTIVSTKAQWDGADTMTVDAVTVDGDEYSSGTFTRRPDLANEVGPPSWAGTDCSTP